MSRFAPTVLAEGGVDIRGLADLDVHDLQARVLQMRNPDRVDHFFHRQVLREWSLEVFPRDIVRPVRMFLET